MRFWTGIGVFVAVVLIAFALFVLHITEAPHVPVPEAGPAYAPITDITIDDSYSSKSGLHTITGTGSVPTPCTVLTATSTVTAADASSSPTIRIDLSAPVDTGICLQLPTAESFSLSVRAAKNSDVAVYANGVLASTTSN